MKSVRMFDTIEEARDRQAREGGHLFLYDSGEAWLFSIGWTATPILLFVTGSGVLNPLTGSPIIGTAPW